MTSLALGWFSSMTATATRGASAGAKAMNQVCDVPRPVWAVPVLPATATPGIWALAPVPPATTPTIMSRTAWATSGGTACSHGLGS